MRARAHAHNYGRARHEFPQHLGDGMGQNGRVADRHGRHPLVELVGVGEAVKGGAGNILKPGDQRIGQRSLILARGTVGVRIVEIATRRAESGERKFAAVAIFFPTK